MDRIGRCAVASKCPRQRQACHISQCERIVRLVAPMERNAIRCVKFRRQTGQVFVGLATCNDPTSSSSGPTTPCTACSGLASEDSWLQRQTFRRADLTLSTLGLLFAEFRFNIETKRWRSSRGWLGIDHYEMVCCAARDCTRRLLCLSPES